MNFRKGSENNLATLFLSRGFVMQDFGQTISLIGIEDGQKLSARRYSHHAMATVWEVFITHKDESYAQQAAFAAFTELDRLEQDLSRFLPNSDISRINALPAGRAVRVGIDTFQCIKRCKEIYDATKGAFDISIGPLYDAWLNPDKSLRTPSQKEISLARERVGMEWVVVDEEQMAVGVLKENMRLDLGGFGKGYALDRVQETLSEWDILNALVHGGSSSALAIGRLHDLEGWPITISDPRDFKNIVVKLALKDRALSGSGLRKGKHILHPRLGKPVTNKLAAWASTPDAATSDALSTAFMVMSPEEITAYCKRFPETQALVYLHNDPVDDLTVPLSDKGVLNLGFDLIK
jgi:thiamine biosynthesis lipoprotein